MIGALELGDCRASGNRPRRLDGEHHRLSAGAREADLLQPRRTRPDLLGKRVFGDGRQAERGAVLQCAPQGVHHRRKGMPVDQREEIVGAVEYATPVGIRDPAPRTGRSVRRVRREERRGAHATARRDLLRPIELRSRALAENSFDVVTRSPSSGSST